MTKEEYEKQMEVIEEISDGILRFVASHPYNKGIQIVAILRTAAHCEIAIREENIPELNSCLDISHEMIKNMSGYGKWNEC